MKRTLTDLRKSLDGDVCILLRDAKTGEQFLHDAQREGFTIGGGKPTAHPYAQVMALHEGTITYVGACGMIRFGCGDTDGFHRVDYAKYTAGLTPTVDA